MPKLATATRLCILSAMVLIMASVVGCATDDGYGAGSARSPAGGKIQACRAGDQMVNSPQQCLQDSAACYQISNGNYCTGERGNTCPAGSSQIADAAACPRGTRCIQFGEGLHCAIQIR